MDALLRDLERENPSAEELQFVALFLGDTSLGDAALQMLLNRSLEEHPLELPANLFPDGVEVCSLE